MERSTSPGLTSKGIHDLLLILTDTEHDAGLRHSHALLLGMLEDAQTSPECCPPVPDKRRHGFRGLDVVSVHVKARLRYKRDMVQIAGEVPGESLYENLRGPENQRKREEGTKPDMGTHFCLIFIMVSAKWCAPPSAKSLCDVVRTPSAA